jgi:hypothetical protein
MLRLLIGGASHSLAYTCLSTDTALPYHNIFLMPHVKPVRLITPFILIFILELDEDNAQTKPLLRKIVQSCQFFSLSCKQVQAY